LQAVCSVNLAEASVVVIICDYFVYTLFLIGNARATDTEELAEWYLLVSRVFSLGS
jgi:hypothetical protein